MIDPLAELRARFVARTIKRVAALRTAIERVAVDADAPAQIVDLAHQLAGSAGTFGYTALSHAAATLEVIARQRCSSSAHGGTELLGQTFSEIESCTLTLTTPSPPAMA